MTRLLLIVSLLFTAGCNPVTKTYTSDKGTLTIKGAPSKYSKDHIDFSLKAEKVTWEYALEQYANVCLKDLKPGQEIPKAMSVTSTECYNKYIIEYVLPFSIKPKQLENLTKSYLHFAQEYETTDMTFEQYQKNLTGAYNLYNLTRMAEVALVKD
ncbi:MAG: hypothetical protein COA45_05440 [Zetaproteobacteria bacterium]|nr:MAG: hypothetical protein COA45_05440 [Zetaproteobacteria bacterium]